MAVVGDPDAGEQAEKSSNGSAPRAGRRESARAQQTDVASDTGALFSALAEPDLDYWNSADRTEDERQTYMERRIYPAYQTILQELYNSADMCADQFKTCRGQHERWRQIIIISTGALAIWNSATAVFTQVTDAQGWLGIIAFVGAAGAALLALLANLENFSNYLDRAQAYGDSRELFLDSAREFERLWETYVMAFWLTAPRAEACINAEILYRLICARDQEVRKTVKEMTEREKAHGAS
jgi:hypothetical protein